MASTTDTNNYKFNHSMLRVKDPKESVKFYSFLGMSLIKKLSFPDSKFDLYFLGYDAPGAVSHGKNAACQRIEDEGYQFKKKLTDGKMRHIAFVLDPDGYWVEVIGTKKLEETEGVKETDVGSYRMVG
ncbi:Lactoylglutathione lyase [Collariella sp. IMI 366227]|nr:Lactoylglutathione lyase [Collariella sp. IMI 366227]